jgi:hypothetical protein
VALVVGLSLAFAFARSHAGARDCESTQQLWVSQPLLEKLSVDGIQSAVDKFSTELTDPNNAGHPVRKALSEISVDQEASWPKMLLADADAPEGSSFLIPSQFHAGNIEIPKLRFGKAEIEAQKDADGKPLANHYRVRVPVEALDVSLNIGLDSKIPGQKPKELFGVQGLRASLDRSKAPNDPPPFIEYDVELKAGQTLADAIEIQSKSGKFHIPASQLDIGLAFKPGDEKRRDAYEHALHSAELQAVAERISRIRTHAELERLLSSDEIRALDRRNPGIGEHLDAFVKKDCNGLRWGEAELELSQSLILREIGMKLALDVLKPQVANRSSLEALVLMKIVVNFAGRVEKQEREKKASGEKPEVPSIGKAGETPIYDGIPGVYPILNEQVGPILAERLAASLKSSSLSKPFATTVPGKTPRELLKGDPREKAKPFDPNDRMYETRKWVPAHPSVGGAVASVSRCGEQKVREPNTTEWLRPELAARLAQSQSAAVGVTVEEVNSYLAEAFSEKSQNVVEYRNKDANDALEKARKEARKSGQPEPAGKTKLPDKNVRLTFTRPPLLVVEKDPKSGKSAMFLDSEMHEYRGGLGGFLSGGTTVRAKVRIYQDQKGMLRMDASKTGQRFDDRNVIGVFDTLLQAVTGRMIAKEVVLKQKVIPGLNESIQLSPQIADWRINAFEPSPDGKRVVLGLRQSPQSK